MVAFSALFRYGPAAGIWDSIRARFMIQSPSAERPVVESHSPAAFELEEEIGKVEK